MACIIGLRCLFVAGAACALAASAAPERTASAGPPRAPAMVRVRGDGASIQVAEALIGDFHRLRTTVRLVFMPRDTYQVARDLFRQECEVGFLVGSLAPPARDDLGSGAERFTVGRFVVGILVNKNNAIQSLTQADLARLFGGQAAIWSDVDGSQLRGRVELFSPSMGRAETYIFKRAVFSSGGFAGDVRDVSTLPLRQKSSTAAIVGAIAKERLGIGFCLFAPTQEIDNRVRVVAVSKDRASRPVLPTGETIAAGSYPFADKLALCVRPDAPASAHEFADFATGPEGAKILKQHGLWPEYELKKVRGEMRFKEMQAGKGTPVAVCGLSGGEELARALAVEYVKAKALVQVKYDGRATAEEAERAFGEKGELLVEEGVVRGQLSVVRGQLSVVRGQLSVVRGQLSVAGGAKQLTTDHGQPTPSATVRWE